MKTYKLNIETLGKNANKKWTVAAQRNILTKGKICALVHY